MSRRSGAASAEDRRTADGRHIWALKDVSFSIHPGEIVGVIGRNGAGKSTILKILSRVTEPTSGLAIIHGRIGSLLEVGAGFHPELTGRENVYFNGAILGMSRREIRSKFDEIVAFAEMEQFIDTPVKRYSSGMYMRLAFAVAAHLEPEILLVDEVLAVGDVKFQQKCLGKMGEIVQGGRTVLFVSHNLDAVKRLCSRCLLFERGRLVDDGDAGRIVERYLSAGGARSGPNTWVDVTSVQRSGTGAARFTAVQYRGDNASIGYKPYSLGSLELSLMIESDAPRSIESLAVTFYTRSGTKLVNADTASLNRSITLDAGLNLVKLRIHQLYLNPGVYQVGLWLANPLAGRSASGAYDFTEAAFDVEVVAVDQDTDDGALGSVVPCTFDVTSVEALFSDGVVGATGATRL